jgi:hypothetical protein
MSGQLDAPQLRQPWLHPDNAVTAPVLLGRLSWRPQPNVRPASEARAVPAPFGAEGPVTKAKGANKGEKPMDKRIANGVAVVMSRVVDNRYLLGSEAKL